MRHFTFLLLFAVSLFSTTSTAQTLEKSLLWEISGNGLEQPSYLYGTIHMTCDASLDANIKKALDDTSLLVLEVDMDDPSMAMKMANDIYMKDGKTLKDLVSAEDYTILSDFLKTQTGMPAEMIGNIKPFFITAMMYPKLLDCAAVQSFENELMKIAHEQEEEVLGLETVEEQMAVFDQIPYKDQAQDLLRSAKDNMSFDKAAFQKMMEIYVEKDIEGLAKLMEEDVNLTNTKHKDVILDNRNKNWIAKIEDFAKQQPTFFGVGAGHLPGENGVIKLLQKKGYTVKPIM
ncbi:TraB/GumN family protein [Meridianimaribacter sp. CL38]|uniref:TraB/GumN family protein n=1 Tax=Meridianimaribacter sp. CL38 TaxID=2213021 RepID=UPI00103E4B3A|nr:TraB/GumN family protein [Meridianimaribacter sp. CL38]TBV26921.1 TraB/GumN family protein [Meridianimaribacter sp. CL38]